MAWHGCHSHCDANTDASFSTAAKSLARVESVVVVVRPLSLALVLVGAALASAALTVAESRPAIVGSAALGSTRQYESVDAAAGVAIVDIVDVDTRRRPLAAGIGVVAERSGCAHAGIGI